MIERLYKTLKERLVGAAIDEGMNLLNGEDWLKLLPAVVYSYNNTINRMTGYSPFEILFGNAPRFPIDIALNLKMNNISVGDNDVEQYRRALNFQLQSIYSKVNQTQDMYDLRRKRSFDEGRTDVRYCVGDHVTL